MAKVLVICAKRYNGHELWTLLKRLREYGHDFEVVSAKKVIRDELTLEPNSIDRTFYEVPVSEVSKFDGVSVVSGNMKDTEAYWTNEKVLSLLNEFRHHNKVVSAICCSVPTLAPVCKGIRVAPFPLVRARQRLLLYGAILDPVSICVDQQTVTAENQMMSYLWGNCISELLQGKEPSLNFAPSRYAAHFRGKTPRRLRQDLEEQLSKFRPTPPMQKKV